MTEKETKQSVINLRKHFIEEAMREFYMYQVTTNGVELKIDREKGVALGRLLYTLRRFGLLNKREFGDARLG